MIVILCQEILKVVKEYIMGSVSNNKLILENSKAYCPSFKVSDVLFVGNKSVGIQYVVLPRQFDELSTMEPNGNKLGIQSSKADLVLNCTFLC